MAYDPQRQQRDQREDRNDVAPPKPRPADVKAPASGVAGARNDWPAVPGYEILRSLGEGPLGEVYKARQVDGARHVALRVLPTSANIAPQEQTRLLAVAEALAAMQHPNIAAVYGSGHWDGGLYFATELLEGESLAAKIDGIPQSERHAAEIVETLARAVHFCHERQIIHRDLKPSNIVFTTHELPKVVDFGLTPQGDDATETVAGMVTGTAAYIAPEMAAGGIAEAGPAADVHSLGVILYEMLTGRPPFVGADPAEAIQHVLEQEPISPRKLRPTISSALETICLKCLEKLPEKRYASCDELANDVRRFLAGQPIEAQPPSSINQFWQSCQEKPMMVGAAAGLVVLLVGATALITSFLRSEPPKPTAKPETQQQSIAGKLVPINSSPGNKDDFWRTASQNGAQPQNGYAANGLGGAGNLSGPTSRNGDGRYSNTSGYSPRTDQAQAGKQSTAPVQQATQDTLDTLRRQYVAQIRLAKQAWDRGDVGQVTQLLKPYATDPQKQSLRNFAWYYLWRAAGSDALNTLRGHTQTIRQAAFTPDGNQVLTFGDEGALILWDAAKGTRLQAISLEATGASTMPYFMGQQGSQTPGGLAVDSDGTWYAAYGKTIWIGNFAQADKPRRIDHSATIVSLALSHDGKLLAAGDDQGVILVRQMPDGRTVQQFKDAPARALAFSRDGTSLWAGTQFGMLWTWDVASGALRGSDSFSYAITSLAVANDGQLVAVAVADRDGVVRLWEPAQRRVRCELRGHQDEVTHVAFDSTGGYLVTACRDQTARLWSTSGSLLRTFKGHYGEVQTAVFSPDGERILTAGADHLAIVWYTHGNQEFETVAGTPALGWIDSLAFNAAGDQLVATGCAEDSAAFMSMWNVADTGRPVPLQVPATEGTALGFSPDGRFVAMGEATSLEATAPSRVRVWSLEASRMATTITGLTGRIRSVAYSPDGRLLAAALGDREERIPGQIRLWDTATGAPRQTLSNFNGRVEAAFTPDGKLLVTVSESNKRPGEIRLWNPATGEPLGQIDKPQELDNVTTMALSPDGKFLVTAHGDVSERPAPLPVKMNLWDLTKKQFVATLPPAHNVGIMRLAFSRRGMLLASGDASGTIRMWDFAKQKPLPTQFGQATARIVSLVFDRLGDRLASGAAESRVHIWHVDTGRELARLELTTGSPAVVRYTPDGNTLLATTTAGGLIAWDAQTYRVRGVLQAEGNLSIRDGHTGEITAAAMAASGELITAGVDKSVRRWDLKSGKFLNKEFVAPRAVACLAISPDGRHVALGTGKYKTSFEPGELLLGQLSTKDSPASLPVVAQGMTPISLAFTPDGNTLVACVLSQDALRGFNQSVMIFNVITGKSGALTGGKPLAVALSPDGRLLAVGHSTGTVELWNLDSYGAVGMNPAAVLTGHQGPVLSLAFSPDGKTLVSGGYDRNAHVWDVATGEDLLVFKHNGEVEIVRFAPDGLTLAAADRLDLHNSVRLWRGATDGQPGGTSAIAPFSTNSSAGPGLFPPATGSGTTDNRYPPADNRNAPGPAPNLGPRYSAPNSGTPPANLGDRYNRNSGSRGPRSGN